MERTILQIILGGKIPIYLQSWINSVIEYAQKNNWKYEQITNCDKYFSEPTFGSNLSKFIWYRHVSDYIRTKILSTIPNICYIDWDVFLDPLTFKIPDESRIAFGKESSIDCILYNGNDLEAYKYIHSLIELPNFNMHYNLSDTLKQFSKKNKVQILNNYWHLDNCRFNYLNK